MSHLVPLALLSQSIVVRKVNRKGFANLPVPGPADLKNLKIDGCHLRPSRIQVTQSQQDGVLIVGGKACVGRRQTPGALPLEE